MVVFIGCNDDFLDTTNLYEKDLDNFYSSPQDIEEAMSGVYNALYVGGVHSNEHLAANLMSDKMLGGGGPDDISAKNVDAFIDPTEDTYRDLWVQTYNGVTRANAILEKTPEIDFSAFFKTPEEAIAFKNQAIGEAYFMRAFLYFRAAKFFGGMPLILKIEDPRDAPRSTIPETYAQIASDFKLAIETMPTIAASSIPTSSYGHANKWVAEAYIAKAYLYYTGYMTNMAGESTSDLPLAEGGSLTKTDILGYLNDCIGSSGYALAEDFRNLWPYSYVNESAGTVVLPWADHEDILNDEGEVISEATHLKWVGQDGYAPSFGTGNSETMFVLRYSTADWGTGQQYNNRIPLFFGIRDNSMVPFGQGWGWGTVNPNFFYQWNPLDERKQGSVLEVGIEAQGTQNYEGSKGDHETGFWNKKYTTIQHDGADGIKGMFYYLYDMVHGDPMQLWAAQDFVYMRFADVLLMHSEISENADGLNAVRRRAGLGDVGFSLDALKDERMYEFAFEGLRWFDLVRWGDVVGAYNETIDVNNSGVAGKYSVTYRPETVGLVSIPETEVRLSNGVYEQNPGW